MNGKNSLGRGIRKGIKEQWRKKKNNNNSINFQSIMPRSQRNDNSIDKTFTIVADILLRVMPTTQGEKEASVYYRDGAILAIKSDGSILSSLGKFLIM